MKTRVLLAAVSAVFSQPAPAEEASASTLSTMVAGLQRLQDKMATGDLLALKARSAALKSIGAALDASAPESLNSGNERVAATIYLLSGGAPAPVARKLQNDTGERVALLEFALAFVTTRRGEARKRLGGFDARETDLRLAGQLAYAQAELAVAENPEKAMASLDLARLLAPGGLVEEAALRREMGIVSNLHDSEKFLCLARQYARRFGRSAYFDSFRQILASGVERMSLNDDFANLEKYRSLAAELPAPQGSLTLLGAARSALLSGHSSAARYLSREALKDASLDSHEQARARFYQAAARLTLEDDATAASDLQAIPKAGLDQKDLDLLAAVRRVAAAVYAEPLQAAMSRSPAKEEGEKDSGARAIAQAEAALQRAGAIGKEEDALNPEARAP